MGTLLVVKCDGQMSRMYKANNVDGDWIVVSEVSYVQLKVKDQQGREISFKVRKSGPLKKLMEGYCCRLGFQVYDLRFMVGNEKIAPEDTADNLGLRDNHVVSVELA